MGALDAVPPMGWGGLLDMGFAGGCSTRAGSFATGCYFFLGKINTYERFILDFFLVCVIFIIMGFKKRIKTEEELLEAIFGDDNHIRPESFSNKKSFNRNRRIREKPTRMVRELLFPFVENFLLNDIQWKKMEKHCGPDPRDFLYAYFQNGDGRRLVERIKSETSTMYTFSVDEIR